jgi:hypothetical protein
MRRRQFMEVLGKSLISSAALSPFDAFGQSTASRHLVDTPKKRAEYLARMLKMLCTDIGIRVAGSPEFDKSAELIRREMALSLPQTELDWFEFRGWRLREEPIFYCGGRSIECYPFYGSEDPPKDGARGVLKKLDGGPMPYAIVDADSGAAVAYMSISSYGRAVPNFMAPDSEIAAVPTVCIGKQDVAVLDAAAAASAPARLHFEVEFVPGARTCNIVGTLPGESDEEILVFAHADTTYNTPGANDNTASLIVVLMLAHAAASGTRPKRTMTFMGTGAEEYGLLGAQHYAARRAAEGTLKNIKYCVNFDSLTYGPNLYVHSNDEELTRIMDAIHDDLKPYNVFDPAYPIAFEHKDWLRGEVLPFSAAGARTLDLNTRGYDEEQLPLWHRPEDTAETVPLDCVENSFLVFDEYLRRVQQL